MAKKVNTIEINDRENVSGENATICPHLGLRNDPHTCVNYPSVSNCCYHCIPLAIPVLSQQRDLCLTPEHDQCKVHRSKAGIKMPAELLFQEIQQKKLNCKYLLLLIPLVIAIGIYLLLKIYPPEKKDINLEITNTTDQNISQTLSAQAEIGRIQTQTEIATDPTSATGPTAELTLEPTLTPTRIPNRLDVPIGKYEKFIIHKVAKGESIQQYAEDYNTSSEAIKAVNHNLLIPIWIESYIVIPVSFLDVSGLPPFSAFLVEDAALTIEDIAAQFDCSVYDLLYYNNIPATEPLCYGEWLLIPREKPEY